MTDPPFGTSDRAARPGPDLLDPSRGLVQLFGPEPELGSVRLAILGGAVARG